MKTWIIAMLLLSGIQAGAQETVKLPVKAIAGIDKTKPLLFYITGDGGFNSFSTTLLRYLGRQGFPVVALDARAYFWNRKTPEQAANDVAVLITQYSRQWGCRNVVLLGYSIGADVLPFIQTRLPKPVVQQVKTTLLLSPSASTDFEVHLLDMFAASTFNVLSEINKWQQPVIIFLGSDENKMYLKGITSKTAHLVTLAGGHHYDNNIPLLATELVRYMGF